MARRESFKDQPQKEYWFPRKTYGWGWGIPSKWQGWAVLVAYIALLIGASLLFPPATQLPAYLLSVFGISAVLIAVCYLTGEPPQWQWGRKE